MRRLLRVVLAALCPALFAVFPVLSTFTQNHTDVELSVLWMPLVASIVAGLVVFALFLLGTRSAAKSGVLASVVVVGFFYFGIFFGSGSMLVLAVWLVVMVAAVVALLRLRGDFAPAALALALMGAVLVVPRIVMVVQFQSDHPLLAADDARLWTTPLATPAKPSELLPDIFVIMPDDYERADMLQQYFKFDNTPFLEELRNRGFVVADKSHSPYSDSHFNMAAITNMDYLSKIGFLLGAKSHDIRPVVRVLEDNRASRIAQALGYEYVHIDSDEETFAGGNPDVSPFAIDDSFANLWISKSVLAKVGGPLGFNQPAKNARFRTSIEKGFKKLGSQRPGAKPKFVVFHTLLPHDPYIYDANGKAVTFPGGDAELSSATGRAYYVHQLQYLSTLLLRAIDQIRANAKTPPVIVLQSDEGMELDGDVFGEDVSRQIRVKGITALSMPGHETAGLPDPPNAVNVLRFVFNEYFHTNYPMLPSESFTEGDTPYQTDRVVVK
jgi:hypothetical protein